MISLIDNVFIALEILRTKIIIERKTQQVKTWSGRDEKSTKMRITRDSYTKSFIFRVKTILLAGTWFSLTIIAYILCKQRI